MQVKLITPEKIFFEGEADYVQVPGTLGDFGVLPGHAPFVSTIRPGVIGIDLPNHEKRKVAVLSGIAEVTPEHCFVLAEVAEDCSGMTPAQVEARLKAARESVHDAVTAEDKKRAEDALAMAEAIATAA